LYKKIAAKRAHTEGTKPKGTNHPWTAGGFDDSVADGRSWMKEAGFRETRVSFGV